MGKLYEWIRMSAPNPNLPTPAELLLLALEGAPQAGILAWAVEEMPERIQRSLADYFYLANFSRKSWEFYPKLNNGGAYLANGITRAQGIRFQFESDGKSPTDDFCSLADLIEWRRHNPRPAEVAK